jgi:competence protein ComEC
VALSLAASLATAPLIVLHFGRASLLSVPANLLVLPAVAPIMWLGTIAGALGSWGAPLAALASLPLKFVAATAHAAARAEPKLLAAVAALLPWAGPPEAPTRLTISALDIGQGDATLIQTAGHAVLVDTGPPDGDVVDRLRERGVTRLDVLVVTHAQADHQGGTQAVLDAVPVGMVLDGRDGLPGDWRAPPGTLVRKSRAGERIRAGDIVLDVLSPPPGDSIGEDPNNRATVLLAKIGRVDVLLPADAESDVLGALPLPDIDVLKVSHHGSADPGLPDLLRRIRPETALIEVGEHNTYGHPTAETLQALKGIDVHRTDTEGTVVLQP